MARDGSGSPLRPRTSRRWPPATGEKNAVPMRASFEIAVDLIDRLAAQFDRIAAGGRGDGSAQGEREFQQVRGHLEGNLHDGLEAQVFGDDTLGGDSA